jgi:integrase/recombinase XerC
VPRRNSRGGRSAAEHLIAALRCLYQHAEEDGLINPADNPARKVEKPRRLPSTRRAVADTRLAEINHTAATTGDDPELDTLLLRLHTETACRRGGALALRPQDLDPEQCLILLREKGETVRWQPVSPTLMAALLGHAGERHAPAGKNRCGSEPASTRAPPSSCLTTCSRRSGRSAHRRGVASQERDRLVHTAPWRYGPVLAS